MPGYARQTAPYTLAWDRGGLGDTAQVASAITQQALAATGKYASTSIATALGVAVPVVGAAIAGLTFAVPFIVNAFRGCGETCVQATRIVDQAGEALELNLQAYMQGPHTVSSQRVALDTVDQIFAAVQQACSNPALQDAGRRCISERLVRGGHIPGVSRPGSWLEWYRDPIANDPNVVPDATVLEQLGGQVESTTGLPWPLVAAGALIALAVVS